MKYILLGPPLAGKSKVAEEIYKETGCSHISTGDIVRNLIELDEKFSDKYMQLVENGELLPNDVMYEIVSNVVHDEKNYILDGFPRNIEQAKWYSEQLQNNGEKIDNIIFLTCDEDELIKRLDKRKNKINRIDDSRECLEKRISNFEITYLDLLDYYGEDKRIIDVDTTNLSIKEMVDSVLLNIEIDENEMGEL